MNGIKTNEELEKYVKLALKGNTEAVNHISTYKWYNYYQNIHVKFGSAEDLKNDSTFKRVQKNNPKLHKQIEDEVDVYVDKVKKDL